MQVEEYRPQNYISVPHQSHPSSTIESAVLALLRILKSTACNCHRVPPAYQPCNWPIAAEIAIDFITIPGYLAPA